ncbi:MAG: hypothetical protein RLZZ344_112 [Pseudomonadota bacterium]
MGNGQVLEIGAALATGFAAAGFLAAFLGAAFFAAGFLAAAFLAAGFLAAAFFAAGFLAAAFLAAGFLAAAFFAAGFLAAAFLAAGFLAAAFFAAGFLAAAFLAAGFLAATFFAAGLAATFAAVFFTSGLAAFAFFAFFFAVAITFLLHADLVDKVTGRFEPFGSNHSFAQEKKAAVQRTTAPCFLTPMNTGETARAEELGLATHGLGDAPALFPTEGTTRLILDHTGLEEVAFLFEVDHFGHPGERIFFGAKYRV